MFYIDPERFSAFRDRGLEFEYRKVEFASAQARVQQVTAYLDGVEATHRVFLWVHLVEPHEPYESHAAHPFGDRDIDRYDAEIAPLTSRMVVIDKQTGATSEHEVTLKFVEGNRPKTTLPDLVALQPVFKGGQRTQAGRYITADNASQLSDGAAALVLMEAREAERRGLHVLGAYHLG